MLSRNACETHASSADCMVHLYFLLLLFRQCYAGVSSGGLLFGLDEPRATAHLYLERTTTRRLDKLLIIQTEESRPGRPQEDVIHVAEIKVNSGPGRVLQPHLYNNG